MVATRNNLNEALRKEAAESAWLRENEILIVTRKNCLVM